VHPQDPGGSPFSIWTDLQDLMPHVCTLNLDKSRLTMLQRLLQDWEGRPENERCAGSDVERLRRLWMSPTQIIDCVTDCADGCLEGASR